MVITKEIPIALEDSGYVLLSDILEARKMFKEGETIYTSKNNGKFVSKFKRLGDFPQGFFFMQTGGSLGFDEYEDFYINTNKKNEPCVEEFKELILKWRKENGEKKMGTKYLTTGEVFKSLGEGRRVTCARAFSFNYLRINEKGELVDDTGRVRCCDIFDVFENKFTLYVDTSPVADEDLSTRTKILLELLAGFR